MKQYDRLLVVVDMQPDFYASNNQQLINNICKLCESYISTGDPIILLEYLGYEKTHRHIVEASNNAPVLIKNKDDGSPKIKNYLKKTGLKPKEFFVCGINTDYCVKDTAVGLRHKTGQNVTVIEKCCNTGNGELDIPEWVEKYLIENGCIVL